MSPVTKAKPDATEYRLFTGTPVPENLLLEQYIAAMDRVLQGSVPDSTRRDLLDETQAHLEHAVRTGLERGKSLLESTQSAIDRYGPAKENALDYMASWFQSESRTPMTRKVGRANLISYGIFQMLVVIYYLILQIHVFLPGESMYRIPFSPAQVRDVWPNPLPFPDFSARFFILIGYPLLAPLLGGLIIGCLIPAKAASAVYRGLMPLILISFVMGALLLPMTEGLLFALLQVAFWLPVGCLTAHFSSNLARSWRCRAHVASAISLEHSHSLEK